MPIASEQVLVPVMAVMEVQGVGRILIPTLDVLHHPDQLAFDRTPVRDLATWECLRQTTCTRGGINIPWVPARLLDDQFVEGPPVLLPEPLLVEVPGQRP